MQKYYKNPDVRTRMIEYLGGRTIEDATCVYLVRCDSPDNKHLNVKPPGDFNFYLDKCLDIGRSLWDRESLIVHLEVEYINFDYPAEPYLDMQRSFKVQQPIVDTIKNILQGYGITPLHLLTGRGHHFVWRINQGSSAFKRIAELGRRNYNTKNLYMSKPLLKESVSLEIGSAFSGLGLIMEYLAHCVLKNSYKKCKIPVKLTEVTVGPIDRGREIVSIDVSEYADPIHTRAVRIPFSIYLKPWKHDFIADQMIRRRIPCVFAVPVHEMSVEDTLKIMQDRSQTAELAKYSKTVIPDYSKPMERLIMGYKKSKLKKYHDWFYTQEHEPPASWPSTYDRTPLNSMPPCVRHILRNPNDLLLKPAGIEHVVRVLLAQRWHPRHIAGLIRSKYERNYGWGSTWYDYNAYLRADFYVRLFTGLVVVAQSRLIDFNCQSTKEKRFCFNPEGCNLEQYRKLLQTRRYYE